MTAKPLTPKEQVWLSERVPCEFGEGAGICGTLCLYTVGQRDRIFATLDAERARAARLEEAIDWIMPMAKGYAADHPVGRNAAIVQHAEAIRLRAENEKEER